MLARLFLLIAVLWAPAVQAQVNIEKLRTDSGEDGVSGAFSLSTAFSQGNIDFADFSMGSFVGKKQGKSTTFLIGNGRFAAKRTQGDYLEAPDVGLWDDEAHFSYNALVHLRSSYELGAKLSVEAYSQYEFNEFLLLDRRILGGIGLRYTAYASKRVGLWLGSSAMLEGERLNAEAIADTEEVDQQHWRWSSYGTAKVALNDANDWLSTVYYQPRFDDFSDYRLMGETGLEFAMSERFSFSVNARLRQDSKPPQTPDGAASVLPTDISVNNAIAVKW